MSLEDGRYSFVIPPVMMWAVRKRVPFLIKEGKEYPVKTLRIMANGTQDLCLVRDPAEPAGFNFGLIEETPPENIIWKPDGDLAIFEFHEKLPQSMGGRSILFQETKLIEPLIEEIIRRNPDYIKMNLYDAHQGKDYGVKHK